MLDILQQISVCIGYVPKGPSLAQDRCAVVFRVVLSSIEITMISISHPMATRYDATPNRIRSGRTCRMMSDVNYDEDIDGLDSPL